MPLEPTSEKTVVRQTFVTGRVVQKGNSRKMQGVDVSITTSQGNYKAKTDGLGSYTLTFDMEFIPITRTVTEPWIFNPLIEFEAGRLIKYEITKPRKEGNATLIGFEIEYVYKGQTIKILEETGVNPDSSPSAQSAFARLKAQPEAEAALYDKIYSIDEDPTITYEVRKGYKANEFPDINYSFPKYNPESRTPYKQDKTIKRVLNIVELETITKAVEKDVAQSGTVDTKTAKKVGEGGTRPLPTPQKVIMKAVDTVSNRLIPYIIGILAAFGISQVLQWLNGKKNFQNTKTTCPPRAKLIRQIQKRNRIVKQLNNLFKIIDTATKAIGIALGLLKLFQLIINIFKRLPIPTTIGTPPGPAGGVILSASYGKVIRVNEKFDNLKGKLKLFAKIGGIVLTDLILLRALLTQALALLKIADEKTQQCMEELGDVNETQIAISAELVALSNQQAEEDRSPVVSNVNGFTMGVEVDPKYKVGTLDRRRAVAKDSKGIIILRGEPSFSATDQILIDELAFYITTNNLKA